MPNPKRFYTETIWQPEHTYNLSYLIDQARIKQPSLTVTLLDLKNAFVEVDHMLIKTTQGYHHIPDFACDIILNIYNNFYMTISVCNRLY